MTKTESDDDRDDVYNDIAFMFEGNRDSVLKHYEFAIDVVEKSVHVALHVVDDEPGAVQSGHYLWPAASSLCEYLIKDFDSHPTSSAIPKSVLELGAGMALASLVALQLYCNKDLQFVIVTDHDPGTLEKARRNHKSTLEELYDRAKSKKEQLKILDGVGAVSFECHQLSWGNTRELAALKERMLVKNDGGADLVDLVLGSDLIYCIENVEPLLVTVSKLLSADGAFLLAQSFAFDDATESEIGRLAQKFGFQRIIQNDTLLGTKGCRIQEIRFRKHAEHQHQRGSLGD